MRLISTLAILLIGLAVWPAHAQDAVTKRVQFAAGQSGATMSGRIKGYESVHYLLGAMAGQRMTVEMTASSGAAYFNIFAPGDRPGESTALFIGTTGGSRFEGILPASGDYLVQVFLVRSAARRDETADYDLTFRIASP